MREKTVLQKMFPAFGTVNSITLYGSVNPEAAELVKSRALELHRRFSFFEPGSDITGINEQAGIRPVPVRGDTFHVLSRGLAYGRETGGAFDITAGAAGRLWRDAIRSGQIPSEADIAACRSLSGLDNLLLDEADQTAFLRRRGQQVDLGGIAKGYAADEAARILKEHKVRNALLNFGGTVIAIGSGRKVGIQRPYGKNGESAADIIVEDKAVVTSGTYERGVFSEGRRYHHIIDPHTGRPADSGLLSVTLIGNSALELDALTTGLCVLGEEKELPLLEKRGIEAVLIGDGGEVRITRGVQGKFFLKS